MRQIMLGRRWVRNLPKGNYDCGFGSWQNSGQNTPKYTLEQILFLNSLIFCLINFPVKLHTDKLHYGSKFVNKQFKTRICINEISKGFLKMTRTKFNIKQKLGVMQKGDFTFLVKLKRHGYCQARCKMQLDTRKFSLQ